MMRLSRFLFVGAFALALLAPLAPAKAANVMMCKPAGAGASPGPVRWTAPSGTSYQLDNMGCGLIAAADVSGAEAGGLRQTGALRSLVQTGLTASSAVSPWKFTLPAGAYIREIIVNNTTANAVTGGVKVGTTAGATDVVTALTCGASCLTFVADSALAKRVFSTTVSQDLFMDAVTSHNGASLNITVIYGFF